jgi:hypothetical protein
MMLGPHGGPQVLPESLKSLCSVSAGSNELCGPASKASVTALDSDRWTPMNEGAWLGPDPETGCGRGPPIVGSVSAGYSRPTRRQPGRPLRVRVGEDKANMVG